MTLSLKMFFCCFFMPWAPQMKLHFALIGLVRRQTFERMFLQCGWTDQSSRNWFIKVFFLFFYFDITWPQRYRNYVTCFVLHCLLAASLDFLHGYITLHLTTLTQHSKLEKCHTDMISKRWRDWKHVWKLSSLTDLSLSHSYFEGHLWFDWRSNIIPNLCSR